MRNLTISVLISVSILILIYFKRNADFYSNPEAYLGFLIFIGIFGMYLSIFILNTLHRFTVNSSILNNLISFIPILLLGLLLFFSQDIAVMQESFRYRSHQSSLYSLVDQIEEDQPSSIFTVYEDYELPWGRDSVVVRRNDTDGAIRFIFFKSRPGTYISYFADNANVDPVRCVHKLDEHWYVCNPSG